MTLVRVPGRRSTKEEAEGTMDGRIRKDLLPHLQTALQIRFLPIITFPTRAVLNWVAPLPGALFTIRRRAARATRLSVFLLRTRGFISFWIFVVDGFTR